MPDTTSTTLLRDISGDPQCPRWGDFVSRYRPYMMSVAQARFPEVDVDDVVQETLISLARVLPSYQYAPDENGRFRNYLAGIVLNRARRAYRDALKERSAAESLKVVTEEPGDSGEGEAEWRRELFEIALHEFLADPSVSDWTKRVFVRVAINGESPDTVAKAFQTNRHRVDQAKSRSMERIRGLVGALKEIADG